VDKNTHQTVRKIAATIMTVTLVSFCSPKNTMAIAALESETRNIEMRVILSIFDIRSAASTVVWTCKYL